MERVLDGVPIDDLPDALRPLGEVLAAARSAPSAAEHEGAITAAAAFVTARASVGASRRPARTVGVSVFTVLVVIASTGTAVATARGALPEPMQQVAYEALGVVGISVPSIDQGSNPHPVVVSDVPSTPPASSVGSPSTGGAPAGTAPPPSGTWSAVPGSSGSGSGSPTGSSDATPGSGGQPGPAVPPAMAPGPDGPVDDGGGSDDPTRPGTPEVGGDPGRDTKSVPPGQATKG